MRGTEEQRAEVAHRSVIRGRTAAAGAVVVLLGVGLLLWGPLTAGSGVTQTTDVSWHAQTGSTEVVEDATAELVRGDDGISYRFQSRGLTPGNAYTLWLVVIDRLDQCSDSPCPPGDILTVPATDAQVTYAAGAVASDGGTANFEGSLAVGPVEGWLSDRIFDDPHSAGVHLVINDHGPTLEEFMPGMIQTYRGGCSDDSPFPPIFPETALADGEPGPNTCVLTQVAVFEPTPRT